MTKCPNKSVHDHTMLHSVFQLTFIIHHDYLHTGDIRKNGSKRLFERLAVMLNPFSIGPTHEHINIYSYCLGIDRMINDVIDQLLVY